MARRRSAGGAASSGSRGWGACDCRSRVSRGDESLLVVLGAHPAHTSGVLCVREGASPSVSGGPWRSMGTRSESEAHLDRLTRRSTRHDDETPSANERRRASGRARRGQGGGRVSARTGAGRSTRSSPGSSRSADSQASHGPAAARAQLTLRGDSAEEDRSAHGPTRLARSLAARAHAQALHGRQDAVHVYRFVACEPHLLSLRRRGLTAVGARRATRAHELLEDTRVDPAAAASRLREEERNVCRRRRMVSQGREREREHKGRRGDAPRACSKLRRAASAHIGVSAS